MRTLWTVKFTLIALLVRRWHHSLKAVGEQAEEPEVVRQAAALQQAAQPAAQAQVQAPLGRQTQGLLEQAPLASVACLRVRRVRAA